MQARFATGSHELYQLPIAFCPDATGTARGRHHRPPTATPRVDAAADPELARDVLALIEAEAQLDGGDGTFRFQRPAGSGRRVNPDGPARPIGVEQSNSSIVFGDATVLKVFRRLEPGINPELELLQFLTRHGLRQHRAAAGLVPVRRPVVLGHARGRAALLPRRHRRLGDGA